MALKSIILAVCLAFVRATDDDLDLEVDKQLKRYRITEDSSLALERTKDVLQETEVYEKQLVETQHAEVQKQLEMPFIQLGNQAKMFEQMALIQIQKTRNESTASNQDKLYQVN